MKTSNSISSWHLDGLEPTKPRKRLSQFGKFKDAPKKVRIEKVVELLEAGMGATLAMKTIVGASKTKRQEITATEEYKNAMRARRMGEKDWRTKPQGHLSNYLSGKWDEPPKIKNPGFKAEVCLNLLDQPEVLKFPEAPKSLPRLVELPIGSGFANKKGPT